MTTISKLTDLVWLCLFVSFFMACDYYEPPQLVVEEKINIDPIDNPIVNSDLAEQDKITLYEVSGEDIIKMKDYEVSEQLIEYQNDTVKHYEIWELVKKVIPADHRNKMSQFLIYHGDRTKTSGFVDPTINNLSKWQLAIAMDYAYRKPFNTDGELTFTIIHEFGHILTLNNEQVNAGVIAKNCSNYFVNDGCANSNAYINTFHNKFWEDISVEFNSLENTPEANASFYSKYSDRFVSEYSAKNPMEDIADIFATFVTEGQMREGSTMADQKIQMLYDWSEFNDLRNHIRQQTESAKTPVSTRKGNGKTDFSCLTHTR